jgi:hypothetical protein
MKQMLVSETNAMIQPLCDDVEANCPSKTHSITPRMTSFIKREIKARQRAFSNGDVTKYKELCDKITTLIARVQAQRKNILPLGLHAGYNAY